ncbi:MAG: DUF971 domain-containing protein [Pirellulaceae bacterium]
MTLSYPISLKIVDQRRLQIDWSDGQVRQYSFMELRDSCPCAGCREKRTHEAASANPLQLQVLSPAEARPIRVQSMRPVGNYAYSIAFSDGHDAGIFTFELLLSLGQPLSEDA